MADQDDPMSELGREFGRAARAIALGVATQARTRLDRSAEQARLEANTDHTRAAHLAVTASAGRAVEAGR